VRARAPSACLLSLTALPAATPLTLHSICACCKLGALSHAAATISPSLTCQGAACAHLLNMLHAGEPFWVPGMHAAGMNDDI
jgi:hypothetical protein